MIGGTSVWFNWDTYRIGTVKEGRGGQEKILIAIILLPTYGTVGKSEKN
jgi:hypothetical protein